jgi:phosphoserine phosphatase
VIEEGVRRFEIPPERVLAAELRVTNGLIMGELTDVPTGPGKAISLRRVGLTHPDAVFGNSVHDLAMLEMARCAFPVNPSPALLEEAAKRGWGYFLPAGTEGRNAKVGGE